MTDISLNPATPVTNGSVVGQTNPLPVYLVGSALPSPALLANGSAAAPSLAFTNSTTTGLYRAAADVLGIAQGGRRIFRLDNYDSTPRNLAIGDYAIPSPTALGISNVAIGNNSMFALTDGHTNTAVGERSMEAITTGISNAAFGWLAGATISTGNFNTFLGNYAGSEGLTPLTGVQNTGVGEAAHLSLQGSSSRNSAYGMNASFTQTVADDNSSFGYDSSYSLTTGANNSSFGSQSLKYSSTAADTSAFGTFALQGASGTLLTGAGNSAFGRSALGNTQGAAALNSAFGYGSGISITTGSNNLTLGPSVGGVTLTTGSRNILIGTGSYVDAIAAASTDTLNIGSLIYGTGLGTTTTPAGKVGILTNAPATAFHVVGQITVTGGLGGTSGKILDFGTLGATGNGILMEANNTPSIYASAGATNAGIRFSSAGTGVVQLFTNGFLSEGLRLAHTASAVNYFLVTPGASGANAKIGSSGENLILGTGAAIATSATAGYVMIPTCAGPPTGVPTAAGVGAAALHYDSTNLKLYVYVGAWKSVQLA